MGVVVGTEFGSHPYAWSFHKDDTYLDDVNFHGLTFVKFHVG